jgi:hypothetical protein
MTMFDDPNREALGLEPIWTGAGDPQMEPQQAPEPEPQPAPQLHFSEPAE